jgi:organic radical activating enzyme
MSKSYSINEIFYSLQGEGMRAGTANVFIRFAGCNLTCKMESHGFDCDTEFVAHRSMTSDQIMTEVLERAGTCRNVIFTGGEPLLQLDAELINIFESDVWYLCVETNGSKPLPEARLDWITVSPKVAEHAVRVGKANEVKYVRADRQPIPQPHCKADHYLISPAYSPEGLQTKDLAWCMKLVLDNPIWRLSMQQHKIWKIR